MPVMKISNVTMQLVRAKRPPGYLLSGTILRFDDGAWLVEVGDDATTKVEAERVHGDAPLKLLRAIMKEGA